MNSQNLSPETWSLGFRFKEEFAYEQINKNVVHDRILYFSFWIFHYRLIHEKYRILVYVSSCHGFTFQLNEQN